MKKGVDFKNPALILILFIIINLLFVFADSEINPDELKPEEKEVYDYGKDIEKFLELEGGVQDDIIEDNLDIFIQGFLSNPGNMDKLIDRWFEIKDNKQVLSDNAKKELFKKLLKIDKGFALKLINKHLEKLKKENPKLEKYYRELIQEINIDDSLLEKLVWKGNKLGIEKDGKLETWIDFDKIPGFTKKIEFKNENGKDKIFITIADKKSEVTIKFSSGSLDEEGFIIGKDGKRFGGKPFGIEGVSYNPKTDKVKVDYYDLEGKLQTLELDKQNFKGDEKNKIFEFLKKSSELKEKFPNLNWEQIKEKVGKTLENPELLRTVDEFFGKLGSIELKTPASNQINLGYTPRSKDIKNSVVEFSFNEKGGIEITSTGEAFVASTDSQGKPILLLSHWDKNEEGLFIFNKHGELEAVRGEGIIFDEKGLEYIDFSSGKDLIGAKIIRSSLADAIERGDWTKVLASVEHDSRIIERALSREKIDFQAEAISLLKKQLENEALPLELKNRIVDAIGVLQSNLEQSGSRILKSIFSDKKTREELFNNPNFQSLMEKNKEQAREALRSLTSSENIGSLLEYYKNPNEENKAKLNGAIADSLKEYVDGYESLVASSLVDKLSDEVGRLSGGSAEMRLEPLIKEIKRFVDSEDFVDIFEDGLGKDSPQSLRTVLENGLKNSGMSESSRKKFIDDYDSFISRVTTAVDSEKREFFDRVKSDIESLKQSEYSTQLIIDADSGEIIYVGKERAEVDSKVPLRAVRVNHDGRTEEDKKTKDGSEDVFVLNSNGNLVAWFDGDKTYATRNNFGNVENIASIINEKKQGHELMAISDGKKYSVINPKDPSHVRSIVNQYGNLHIGGIPIVGYVDITTHHLDLRRNKYIEDIGEDPTAELSFSIVGSSSNPGFIFPNGIVSRIVNNKASGLFTQKVSEAGSEIANLEGQLDKLLSQSVTKEDIERIREQSQIGSDLLKFADDSGIKIPKRTNIEDIVKLGEMVSKDDYNGLKKELKPFIEWLSKHPPQVGSKVTIKNDYIDIDGNQYKLNQVLLRQSLREAERYKDKIPFYFRATMGNENDVYFQSGNDWMLLRKTSQEGIKIFKWTQEGWKPLRK